MLRRSLIIIGIVLASASSARATAERRVMVLEPTCAPTWLEHPDLLAALRVELRAIEVRLAESGEADVMVELVAASCDAGATAIHILVRSTSTRHRVRAIDLTDVIEGARVRVLALAITSTIEAEIAATPLAPPVAETDEQVDVTPSEPAPPIALAPVARARAIELAPPTAPHHSIASLGVAAEGGLLARGAVALGGARVALFLRPWADPISVAFLVAVRGLYGTASDLLGEARGLWIDGALGAALELSVDEIRLGVSGTIGVGAVHQEGIASRPTVAQRSHVAPIVDMEVAAQLDVRIAPSISLVCDVHATVILLGFDGRAGPRSLFAVRGLVPGARLGLSVDL